MKMRLSAEVAVVGFLAFAGSAHAAVLQVNSTGDDSDGTCEPLATPGDCTLREAVEDLSGSPASDDIITFNIPGAGPHTILAQSSLGQLERLSIDATTQPGFAGTPLVIYRTAPATTINAPAFDFAITGSGGGAGAVRGLSVGGSFTPGLVKLTGDAGVSVDQTNLGVLPNGTAIGAGLTAVDLGSSAGSSVRDSTLVGSGTSVGKGIRVTNGSASIYANDISNFGRGISMESQFNIGSVDIGDTGDSTPGLANSIHDNGTGIFVMTGPALTYIENNEIFDNAQLGIDLSAGSAPDGVTTNDLGDADTNIQNFPVLTSADIDGSGVMTVTGTFEAKTVGFPIEIEVFASDSCDSTRHGEGERYLGRTLQTYTGPGSQAFTVSNLTSVSSGDYITATATSSAIEGTSEFSRCYRSIGLPSIEDELLAASVDSGEILVKEPGSSSFTELDQRKLIPDGSIIDATNGEVEILSEATAEEGGQREGHYSQGQFKITQDDASPFTTVATLVGGKKCGGKSKDKKGKLLFRGNGKHKTNGKHGAGTVRGTEFLTENKCGSTFFRVDEGSVLVRDFAKKKNVTVNAGSSYTAKAKKKKKG